MYQLTTGVELTFSGDTKQIILDVSTGSTSYNISICGIYDYWKIWVIDSGSSYAQAFRTTGGDVITNDQTISFYYILMNDWKIVSRTDPSFQVELIFDGNLLTSNATSPFDITNSVGSIFTRNIVTSNSITSDACSGLTLIQSGITNIELNIAAHRAATEDSIKYILGLVQSNFRITGQTYNSDNLLTNSIIRIYDNNIDALNDVNAIKEYTMYANYDAEGRLIEYVVTE